MSLLTQTSLLKGYPAIADVVTQLEALGLEGIPLGETNFLESYYKVLWGLVSSVRWAMTLGVYAATPTTFSVRSGQYLYDTTVKTFTAGAAINPADNDTTYVWMAADNTISSGIDGDGWPTAEHVKLAEVDTDEDGVITDIRDMRIPTAYKTPAV